MTNELNVRSIREQTNRLGEGWAGCLDNTFISRWPVDGGIFVLTAPFIEHFRQRTADFGCEFQDRPQMVCRQDDDADLSARGISPPKKLRQTWAALAPSKHKTPLCDVAT